jgi:hypothetical protein
MECPRYSRDLLRATLERFHSEITTTDGRTARVTRWRSGEITLRSAAAAALETEKNSRKLIGCQYLWMLKAALDDCQTADENANSLVDKERLTA